MPVLALQEIIKEGAEEKTLASSTVTKLEAALFPGTCRLTRRQTSREKRREELKPLKCPARLCESE